MKWTDILKNLDPVGQEDAVLKLGGGNFGKLV
jgi:hypothetical protein